MIYWYSSICYRCWPQYGDPDWRVRWWLTPVIHLTPIRVILTLLLFIDCCWCVVVTHSHGGIVAIVVTYIVIVTRCPVVVIPHWLLTVIWHLIDDLVTYLTDTFKSRLICCCCLLIFCYICIWWYLLLCYLMIVIPLLLMLLFDYDVIIICWWHWHSFICSYIDDDLTVWADC